MITTETQFNRRKLITTALGFTGAGILAGCAEEPKEFNPNALTSFDQYRGYSNAYEFGTSKTDPAKYEDSSLQKDGLLILTDRFETSTKSVECHSIHSVKKYSTSDASKHGGCESTTTGSLYPNFLSNTLTRIRNTLASLVSSKMD